MARTNTSQGGGGGGSVTIGDPVYGGTPFEILFVDSSGNLDQSDLLIFDDTNPSFPHFRVGQDGLGTFFIMNYDGGHTSWLANDTMLSRGVTLHGIDNNIFGIPVKGSFMSTYYDDIYTFIFSGDATNISGTANQLLNICYDTLANTSTVFAMEPTQARLVMGDSGISAYLSLSAIGTILNWEDINLGTYRTILMYQAGIEIQSELGQYFLPLDSGTAGQIMVNDGAGQLYWSNFSQSQDGTYSPTVDDLSGISNLDSVFLHQYIHVGNTVIVTGAIEYSPDGNAVAIEVELPVATTFSSSDELTGTLITDQGTSEYNIRADIATGKALIIITGTTLNFTKLSYTFTYQVITP